MKTLIFSLFLISIPKLYESITIDESLFCSKCVCDAKTNVITCINVKFDDNINKTEYWINPVTNESYPIFKLEMHGSEISRLFPFPKSDIKILDFKKNRIQNIDKAAFQYFQNMTDLDLSQNDLVSELFNPDIFRGVYEPKEYQPLHSLIALRLGDNNLHTLHQDTFEHIMNLEILDLHGNPFRVLDVQTQMAISGLTYLRELDLSRTYLEKLPDHIFHNLKYIKILYLNGNNFDKIPRNQLAEAHTLEELRMNENPIIEISEENKFPVLEKLKILHMCYMDNLTRLGNGSLSGLYNLEELYLSNNPELRYIDKQTFSRMESNSETEIWPKIKKLYLKNNKLTHLENELLARWDQLDDIDITENAWSCECGNQWLIDTLVKFIHERNATHLKGLWCASPIEMEGKSLYDIYDEHEHMRCDVTGFRPERDASILIGILIGLLLGIPLVLGILLCYKRNWFGYFDNSPASFSRKFYNRATEDDDFYG